MLRSTLLAACVLAAVAAPVSAQHAYPDKPVKIIVAYTAGQGTDVATRYFAEQLTQLLGQTFYVENRGGAGGNIGTDLAARSAPDGYTLTMGTNATHALNQFLYPGMTYDAARDFAPIALVATFPMALLAGSDSAFTSVPDVLEAARAKKGGADVGMPSTTARLVLELLKEQTDAPLFGVPYKGSSNAMTDVIGKQIPLTIDTVAAARPQVEGGKLKVLGVTSRRPTELLPGAPTVASQGVDGFEVIAWNALYAPKGTPADVVARLNQAVNQILRQPATRQRLLQMGYEPAGGSAQDLADFGQAERRKWEPIIKKAGIRAG
ncbi:tripartite tricarboxylate transporter substrate binding protein [Bordetella sp. BOR01]|uniref:Bug family tripartite tricarboxylate transporter substrate binding protein n=1 Tax=Bordetella sp. BOR01 TaxID=2854779 RepID=UPI001C4420AE|nr:tripartite tricarboxylate transporter substrate binding protein [Bordetella sp. BOR01]MBV7486241.1 tripartite tricarboxylate transporter substrate binding protein [Bordetella sp. BOR01]